MDELIKLLDENLEYESHETIENTIYIYVKSTRKIVNCPYCKQSSQKVHSLYAKSFQDLPIQGKKVTIIIKNRKMFCTNPDCTHKIFAETFDCLPFKSKKTKRLDIEIINISMNVSSLVAEKLLKRSIANVGKSTICNILKKRYRNH
jgi:transposase